MGATPENSNSSRMKSNRIQRRKGPSLASIRRNKVLSTDGHTVKFLYLILKQLDLKPVDWEKIAERTDLSGGNAARARFSRFRRQMGKLLLSEEILEAKLENTEGEDSRLASMDSIEEEVKCLNPFGIKNECSTGGIKFEQDAGNQWTMTGQPFQIKTEPRSYADPVERIKLEIDDQTLTVAPTSRNSHPTVIKIEDDDAMDMGEGSHSFKRSPLYNGPYRKGHFGASRKEWARTSHLSAPGRKQRSGSAQMQRQTTGDADFTAADPDIEVISINGQPPACALPALFTIRNPFSLTDNVDLHTNNEQMKDY